MAFSVSLKVDINSRALAEELRGPRGTVFREGARVADLIKAGARSRISVGKGPGPHLRDSLVKRATSGSQGHYWEVSAAAKHAIFVHEGTRPHVIRPRKAGGVLVFYWDKVGETVFAREVHHPGTQKNPFLVEAARALGLRVVKSR